MVTFQISSKYPYEPPKVKCKNMTKIHRNYIVLLSFWQSSSSTSSKNSNKQIKSVHDSYEMNFNEYCEVENIVNEVVVVPETKFLFVYLIIIV